MVDMTDPFNRPISELEALLQLPQGFTARTPEPTEANASSAIAWLETNRPKRQGFWPALTLALIAQGEKLLGILSESRRPDIFHSVYHMETSAERAVDQLVWVVGDTEVSVRGFYNAAESQIIGGMHRKHPSAAAHATSKWQMYRPFIVDIMATSPGGRLAVAEWVWKHGVLDMPLTIGTAHRNRQPRPFYEILKGLDTGSGTTGGAIFQALVYGYLYADSPTLTVISQRVNTGSRRAGVIGDVSGYLGEHIVLAVEAKDKHLTAVDEADLVTFIRESSVFPDLDAVVFARSFDSAIETILENANVRVFSVEEMLRTVSLWDVPKQESAVRSVRYFLGQIQKDPALVARVVSFLAEVYEVASGQES